MGEYVSDTVKAEKKRRSVLFPWGKGAAGEKVETEVLREGILEMGLVCIGLRRQGALNDPVSVWFRGYELSLRGRGCSDHPSRRVRGVPWGAVMGLQLPLPETPIRERQAYSTPLPD